jgi:hypothetical protein
MGNTGFTFEARQPVHTPHFDGLIAEHNKKAPRKALFVMFLAERASVIYTYI